MNGVFAFLLAIPSALGKYFTKHCQHGVFEEKLAAKK